MVWEGLFGRPLGETEAEALTNFRPELQTWPFRGMLALAEAGAEVRNIENFDPQKFIADPFKELLRQSGDDHDTVEHIGSVSDVEAEIPIVEACLRHPRILFECRTPDIAELSRLATAEDTGIICNVNYRTLVGRDGYNGHFVIVDEVTDSDVRLQDPGLPPLEGHRVSRDTFNQAWGDLPNIIACSIGRLVGEDPLPHDRKALTA